MVGPFKRQAVQEIDWDEVNAAVATVLRDFDTRIPLHDHENPYGHKPSEAYIPESRFDARGRKTIPGPGRRDSSASSVRSMIEERLREAQYQRSYSRAASPVPPASPFRSQSPFEAEYARLSQPRKAPSWGQTRDVSEREHSEEPIVYRCGYCKKQFTVLSEIEIHEALAHNLSYVCEKEIWLTGASGPKMCGQLFEPELDHTEWESKIRRHLTSHRNKLKRSLGQRTPSLEPPYMWPASSQAEPTHRDASQEPGENWPANDTRVFADAVDAGASIQASQHARLRTHLWTCHLCQKSFGRRSTYLKHQRTHSGHRSFACRVNNCTASFKQSNERNRHEKSVHGKSKPWTCGGFRSGGEHWGCGASFPRSDGLREHHRKTVKGRQCIADRDNG